jgi:hypothetical protein
VSHLFFVCPNRSLLRALSRLAELGGANRGGAADCAEVQSLSLGGMGVGSMSMASSDPKQSRLCFSSNSVIFMYGSAYRSVWFATLRREALATTLSGCTPHRREPSDSTGQDTPKLSPELAVPCKACATLSADTFCGVLPSFEAHSEMKSASCMSISTLHSDCMHLKRGSGGEGKVIEILLSHGLSHILHDTVL